MKIKLTSDTFKQYKGAIIDVVIDGAGDAVLPATIASASNRTYAFPDEFEEVSEHIIPGGYTVELQAEDLIRLHAILDVLPEYVLDSAELHKN